MSSAVSRSARLLVIAGVASRVGKTTVTLGLLEALRRKGLTVQAFKVGPDFAAGLVGRGHAFHYSSIDPVPDATCTCTLRRIRSSPDASWKRAPQRRAGPRVP
jgi:cobyrinic acid a,c-diamide synthase